MKDDKYIEKNINTIMYVGIFLTKNVKNKERCPIQQVLQN